MAVSGFFKVEFSALGNGAGGVVTVENGNVRGADNQYLYSGTVVEGPERATAQLRVTAYVPHANDVFGGSGGSFNLSLTGKVTEDGFSFSAPAPQPNSPPITIRGTRVAGILLV